MTADELRAALKRLALSQAALAEKLGKHRVTVARWMSGELEVPRYATAYLEAVERNSEQFNTPDLAIGGHRPFGTSRGATTSCRLDHDTDSKSR